MAKELGTPLEEDQEWLEEEGKLPFEVTYFTTQSGYCIGVHDIGSPFNPSGCDYYFTLDGSYLGFGES